MKKINPKNITLAIIAIVLLAISIRFIRELSFPDATWKIQKDERVYISKNEEAIQKFEASRDDLARIDFLFGNPKKKSGGKMILKILDENCQEKIRESSLEIKDFDSDKTYPFVFKKISNSKEKTFCLELEFSPDNPKNSAKLFLVENNLPENEFLKIAGEEFSRKSLAMQPSYQTDSWLGNLDELNQRISQYKPWFLKHYFLYLISFGFIIASIFLVVLLIFL